MKKKIMLVMMTISICILFLFCFSIRGNSINRELRLDTLKVQKELISILNTNNLDNHNVDMLKDYEYKYDLEQPKVRDYNDEERELTMTTKIIIEDVFSYIEDNKSANKQELLSSVTKLIK